MNILGIIVLILLLYIIWRILYYLLSNPNTLQTLQSAQTASTIQASSLATNNGVSSTNFAYSIWFYINDWNYRYGEPKVIFGRMGSLGASTDLSGNIDSSGNSIPTNISSGSIPGISGLNPCPTVVLGAIDNTVTVALSCYPGTSNVQQGEQPVTSGNNFVVHNCSVSNVPIQRWVNLVMSVYGRTLDLYIDGKLVRTCLLPGTANVNNNANIYVTPQGGFDGWTSKFQYYPNSLNPQDVWNIYSQGYGGQGWFSTNNYSLQVSLLENGTQTGSFTL
jgi:hypothetical protein